MRASLTLLALLAVSGNAIANKPPAKVAFQPTRVPCNLQVITHNWDFALGDQGFTTTVCDPQGGGPAWEWGATTYIPGAPPRVWGTILQTDYRNDSGQGLVSPRWLVDNQSYLVEIRHYFDIENEFDGCNLVVNPHGTVWDPMGGYPVPQISPNPDFYAWCVDTEPGWTGQSGDWKVECFDLSEFMGQTISVELDFGSDVSVTGPGWYVASVRVGGTQGAEGACCDLLTGDCSIATEVVCLESGGVWHPEWTSCQPNPCPQPCALDRVTIDWDFAVSDHNFQGVDCDQGGASVWEWGPTTYIPGAIGNVWGTILSGDYPNDSGLGIASPSFVVDSQTHLLEVYHYFDIENTFDGCNVAVGVWPNSQVIEPIAGYTVNQISPDPSFYAFCVDMEPGWTGSSGNWRVDCFDLSQYMGQTISVEFDFGSDQSVTNPGWYLSRVRVGGTALPRAVCCDPVTGGCSILTQEECAAAGGVWNPDENSCVPNPCPQPRAACCDPVTGECQILTQQGCAAIGGVWHPNQTSCVPNPCPQPQAVCCDPVTGQCQILTQQECSAIGGVWNPNLTSCQPNPCPQPGQPCADCGPGPHWIDQCVAGLDHVADQAAKVGIDTDLDPNCVADLSMVMRPCPAPDNLVIIGRSAPRDDSQNFPGLRPVDGHLDVIDTELQFLCLTASGVTLRVGAGQGQGGILPPSYGAIAEQRGDVALGDSFFDVFFEVDLGGGMYVYNHEPLRLSGDIDCVPPQVGYIHLVDCIALYTDPQGGQHVANLTSAEHVVNPGEDPAVCCLETGCEILTMEECFERDGMFHPELTSCVPDPCLPPGQPCADCGPGPHWIDQCAAGLDHVADQAAKVGIDTDLDPNCTADLSMVMRPCPAPDDQVVIRRSDPLDDSQNFPGLRPLDGHLDVIDTELLSLCLTASGVTLRVGAGLGQGGVLPPSYGAIAEQPGDIGMGDSFFDVFFEVDLGGGMYVYNHEPLRIAGDIDCVPPQVGYIHLVDCIALYTDPVGGQHVANLTSAEHVVNPGEDPAVCCLDTGCEIVPLEECFERDGMFHPEWTSCVPDPCPLPGQPCVACGPGPHWIDQCAAGLDHVADQAAKVGIDTDLDPNCTADLSMVMRPCPAPDDQVVIRRSDPLDDSQNFPGLRPVDGHRDVIDTELLSLCLTASGVTLRVGAGQGQGGVLPPSYGAIAELPGDTGMGDSFFDVYFEVDLGGGMYVYNHEPLRIAGDIDCVPPQVGYIHLVDCIALYTDPVGGQHVANLTSAEHVVNPGEDPAVCCLDTGCEILPMDECFNRDGLFHPELTSCVPDPCPLPGQPCADCGPGPHWIDQCQAGLDHVADQAAKVGIDTDLDPNCAADLSMVMRPCPAPDNLVVIRRSDPLDDSQNFPGLRQIDGHMDVIDTELQFLCLTAGGVTLRVGAGQGQGGVLPPSYGAIAELPGDTGLGDSFFDVYFEVDLGGGMYVYNHEPLRISGEIDCVPPQVGYIHIVDCLPLYTDPVAGQHVANLTSAQHAVNPGQDPAVCCLESGCQILPMEECFNREGMFHPEWTSCSPNPCPGTTGVDDSGLPVGRTALFSAIPNPFTGATLLKYYLAERGQLGIDIYDASGRHVRNLLSIVAEAGPGSVEWDGRDDVGGPVGSGVYFARLNAGGELKSQRMIVLK